MTRMSEERLAEIRRFDLHSAGGRTLSADRPEFDRRDLLAEVDALRAELSAFRRAVLTDGAGGTEEEVTPEAVAAELRLLRTRPGQCKDVLEVAGDRIQCERIRGHESGHSGEAFDWSDP